MTIQSLAVVLLFALPVWAQSALDAALKQAVQDQALVGVQALAASRAALRIDLGSSRYAVVLYSLAGEPAEGNKRVQAALDADGF